MKNKLGALAILLLVATGTIWAGITASISGTVTDPTGAVIPGAAVTAHNTDTGIDSSTQTNAQGYYSFPALPTGKYEVTIKATGFEEFRETGLVLDVNTALRVDAAMKVGSVSQEVSVSSTSVHVETTNTQMGEVIGTTKMTSLPLNGRSYTDLLALQPGVAPASSGEGSGMAVSGNLNPGGVSVSGQREAANGFIVNGGNAEERLYNNTAIIPNLDSIAEFRILTNNADAEYGNYSGGMINVITKSGTNQYHGDAFDFIRNPHLDARNFYSPTEAVLHQNQFGGTAGGPILHDKLFFFTDYQGTRMVNGLDSGVISVPSAQDQTGNLSDVASDARQCERERKWNCLGQHVVAGIGLSRHGRRAVFHLYSTSAARPAAPTPTLHQRRSKLCVSERRHSSVGVFGSRQGRREVYSHPQYRRGLQHVRLR